MIKLTKDGTATPADYSIQDGLVPITAVVTLDGSGGTEIANSSDPVFVWANNLNSVSDPVVGSYTGISLTVVTPETGITWELSPNGTTGWANSINLADIVVTAGYQSEQVYARCTVVNDGSIPTNNYVSANVRLQATETPE